MPMRPRNVRSCSRSSLRYSPGDGLAGIMRTATPIVRNASPASASFACPISVRRASLSATTDSPVSSCEQSASSTSGAPLMKAENSLSAPSPRCTVVINFRSAENGISATRGKCASRSAGCRPTLRAATMRAPSVGSPCTSHRPSCSRMVALLTRSAAVRARRISRCTSPSTGPPPSVSSVPTGSYPVPPTCTLPLAVTMRRTVISLRVSVPVLSDAMTVADPSVSTAARCRTMARRVAMRCTPSARTAVTTAGSPSGTAATASATPSMSTSNMPDSVRTPLSRMMVPIMIAAITTTTMPSSRPTRSSSRCSGVGSSDVVFSRPAMRPISVAMAVCVTTALPRPEVTVVPLYTMFRRSPRSASPEMGPMSLTTGKLSPVNAASAVCSELD